MYRILSRLIMIVMCSSLQSLHIIAMEPAQSQNSLSTISDDSITTLYKINDDKFYLYIPIEQLVSADGDRVNLKDLFEKNGLCTKQASLFRLEGIEPAWSDTEWQSNLSQLITMQTPQANPGYRYLVYHDNKYSLNKLVGLLADAKILIKSFLGPDTIPQGFVKKEKIGRIFTYAQLRQVIKEKNLVHVKLPQKYVYIKDAVTGEYLSREQAEKVIDNALKACISDDLSCGIDFTSDRYKLEIFASREKSEGKGLSKATVDELFVLCKEAPFDIGNDNIFWDAKGDAIIIDTEYKGSTTGVCGKVGRYPVDPDL